MTRQATFKTLAIATFAGVLGMCAFAPGTRAGNVQQTACTQKDVTLPAPMTTWPQKTIALKAAASPAAAAKAVLVLGHKADVVLQPAASVTMALKPEKTLVADRPHSGLLALHIPAAGSYRIIVGTNAWIDIVADGKLVSSSAFGDSPKCSTIRKFVVFPLKPGMVTVQLSGVSADHIDVLALREH